MCGIAGLVSFSGRPVESTALLAMCEAIRHRGPDDRGIITLPADRQSGQASVGLGSQRLSIIDVAGGHQPIPNEDETVWAVLNGELYNFQALRRDLEARGHRFRTSSDTEVIVHLYEDKGDAFVADLEGMFALALWDARRERLLLAPDRFGKKPLLYVDEGERFRFGSEFRALLAAGDLPLDLDLDALDASSAIPSFYLARLTRQHVTVALNGDGGDEAFAGYGRHLANRLAESWQVVPGPLRRAAAGVLGHALGENGDRRSFRSRARRFLRAAAGDRAARYQGWVGVFSDDLKAELVSAKWRSRYTAIEIAALFGRRRRLDAVDAFLAADTDWYLPTDLLVKMDIATMANSLEARSPFLDHHLVEFVARLPSRLKLRGRRSKYVLKRAVSDLVPPENLRRAKRGFAVPIGRWFRRELREFLHDHLLDRHASERGLFDRRVIERLVNEHEAGQRDHAHHLWVLLMFELWSREFVDTEPTRQAAAHDA
jgi:asparagine synthetase B (glutamine-hydrolysing)